MHSDDDIVLHKVYPVRQIDNKIVVPESTLYWLMHPWLNKECSKLEAGGFMLEVSNWIGSNSDRKSEWKETQRDYAATRWNLLSAADKQLFDKKGWTKRFKASGIGGVRGWDNEDDTSTNSIKLKCLHLHYAHFLAQSKSCCTYKVNIVGKRVHKEIKEILRSLFFLSVYSTVNVVMSPRCSSSFASVLSVYLFMRFPVFFLTFPSIRTIQC